MVSIVSCIVVMSRERGLQVENQPQVVILKGLSSSDLKFKVSDLIQLPLRFVDLAQFGSNLVGSGFLVSSLYKSIKGAASDLPKGLRVEAVDGFYAVIPWDECETAIFQHADENGCLLENSGPLRLFVPNGSSECLNVKSVVSIEFLDTEITSAGFGNIIMKLRNN